ncbi:MAG: oligoribonuclease [Oligoflexia bacterium]|nr:oligoribonuclease [Oligoflexia bacterium]
MNETDKNKEPNNFKMEKVLWLDLEMTGLSPETDVIIEAAAIITDKDFNELEAYQNVIKQERRYLEEMDSWNQKCHRKSGLYDLISQGKSLRSVEQDLLSLLETHFNSEDKVVIAGNCIYQDRNFIRKYMPRLDKKLYYRMLDVTAWKLIAQQKGYNFEKENKHRALDDTRESIKEMLYYLKNIEFKPNGVLPKNS